MEMRALGAHGPQVSVIGLGCNMFGPKLDLAASRAVINAALDAGVTHLDTAESYGGGTSEEFIGATLGSRRDHVVIATKFHPRPKDEPYAPGLLAKRIREGCDISLRRLRTDHIDLYYQHFPDPAAPVEEALESLDALVRAGKVLHLGCSNFTGDLLRRAADFTASAERTGLCGTQLEWNLLNRQAERDAVPVAVELELGIVPYFPLASGLLTGKYRRDAPFPSGSRLESMDYFKTVLTPANFNRVDQLTEFAAERGHTVLELAIAWLLAQDGVASVITGATTPAQVEANVPAAGWRLTSEDLSSLPA
jgi:aryl-alcohol dehydrogenase-like predicted oxidoreductase